MTDADLTALRTWAESHAPAGSVQAQQVLALLAERDAFAAAVGSSETSNTVLSAVLAQQRARLAPVVEFVRRVDLALKVSGPDSAPDAAVVTFSMPGCASSGLTLGDLRALVALLQPPAPPATG